MTTSWPERALQFLVVIGLIAAFFLATFAWSLQSAPCGPSPSAPATGSHDRGRTI